MGFSVPLADWLRGDLKSIAESYLFKHTEGLNTYFKPEVIKNIWQQHQNRSIDHSSVLWSMLMFQMWYSKYIAKE